MGMKARKYRGPNLINTQRAQHFECGTKSSSKFLGSDSGWCINADSCWTNLHRGSAESKELRVDGGRNGHRRNVDC